MRSRLRPGLASRRRRGVSPCAARTAGSSSSASSIASLSSVTLQPNALAYQLRLAYTLRITSRSYAKEAAHATTRHRGQRTAQGVRHHAGTGRHLPHRPPRDRVRTPRPQWGGQDHHGQHPVHARRAGCRSRPRRRARRRSRGTRRPPAHLPHRSVRGGGRPAHRAGEPSDDGAPDPSTPTCHRAPRDRKSTRLNSSHVAISYAVFCSKKKQIAIGCTDRASKKSNDFSGLLEVNAIHSNNNRKTAISMIRTHVCIDVFTRTTMA